MGTEQEKAASPGSSQGVEGGKEGMVPCCGAPPPPEALVTLPGGGGEVSRAGVKQEVTT